MAAHVLRAELKHRDGSSSSFTVEAENNLKSLICGVKKLNSDISAVLSGYVEEERAQQGDTGICGEQDDDEEEEESDEEETNAVKSRTEPPNKRPKTVTVFRTRSSR